MGSNPTIAARIRKIARSVRGRFAKPKPAHNMAELVRFQYLPPVLASLAQWVERLRMCRTAVRDRHDVPVNAEKAITEDIQVVVRGWPHAAPNSWGIV